jgi:hypothetical protein
MSTNTEKLLPSLRTAAAEVREEMAGKGINVIYTCFDRTKSEQVYLASLGRTTKELLIMLDKAGFSQSAERVRYWVKQGMDTQAIRDASARFAGCYQRPAANCQGSVTWTLKSNHFVREDGFAHALDFAVARPGSQNINWDLKADVNKDEHPDYLQVADAFVQRGFSAGAYWSKNKDYPHVETKDNA